VKLSPMMREKRVTTRGMATSRVREVQSRGRGLRMRKRDMRSRMVTAEKAATEAGLNVVARS
jgi:hypothetical protein